MRAQTQKKQTQSPSYQQIIQSQCQVCFVPFNKVPYKQIQEGLQILICSRCNIVVHKSCYDLDANVNALQNGLYQFLCQRCSSKNPQGCCFVCYGIEGAMKVIQDQLVHVFCGLVHNQIDIVSYYPSIVFKKSQQYEQVQNLCQICRKKNAYDKCGGQKQEGCRLKVHSYCAKKMYVQQQKKNDQPHSWNHHMHAGSEFLIDLTDEIIPFDIFEEQINNYFREAQQYGFVLPLKSILKKIYKEYTDQLRSKRKQMKKLRRGGFAYVLCTQHEIPNYCLCDPKIQGPMVQCQCCFEWYHQQCVMYTQTQQSQKYICSFCKKFYQYKKKIVQQMRGGRGDYQLSKIQVPLKLNLNDCIWLMRVIDVRFKRGQAPKMVKQLSKYPLKSSALDMLIRIHNKPKLDQLRDLVIKQLSNSYELINLVRPKVVLALDPQGRDQILSQNVAFNKHLRHGIESLIRLGLGGSWTDSLLKELDFKERAITDSYDQIIELSKAEQPYQEIQILKQKAQAYSFLTIINQIKNNVLISLPALLDSISKAQITPSVPSYVLEILKNKWASVSVLYEQLVNVMKNSADNSYHIYQIIDKLKHQGIQQPKQFIQYRKQKLFIQEIHTYYIKQQAKQMANQNTTSQKLMQLLKWSTIKPSLQLTNIVSNYSQFHSNCWKQSNQLFKRCQIAALLYEIKDIKNKKKVKYQKFNKIISKINKSIIQTFSQQIKPILYYWHQIKQKVSQIINISTQKMQNLIELSETNKKINDAVTLIQKSQIKIQDDQKPSQFTKLKNKKQQIQQLMVLYTECQLSKNPLTISKLCPSLSLNNPLVVKYLQHKKLQHNLLNKYQNIKNKILTGLSYFKGQSKKQRKQQLADNSKKPEISEIQNIIQQLSRSPINFYQQIQQLKLIEKKNIQIAIKVNQFLQQNKDINNVTNLVQINKIKSKDDQLRKKILNQAQLNLKNQLEQIYHLEILIRMKYILFSPNIQLEKAAVLLEFAEQQGLYHDQTYKILKQKYDSKSQKSKQLTLIKSIQQGLSNQALKDSSGNYVGLFNYRKKLHLLDPNQIKIKNISHINQLIQKNKIIRNKIINLLQKNKKVQIQQVKTQLLQALKHPFQLPDIDKLSMQYAKTWDLQRKWKDLHRNGASTNQFFSQYNKSLFIIQDVQRAKESLELQKEEHQKLKQIQNVYTQEALYQFETSIQKMQINAFLRQTDICFESQKKYVKYWLKYINQSKENKRAIPYQKIRRLQYDIYFLLQKALKKNENYEYIKNYTLQLQCYLSNIKKHLRQYPTLSEYVLVDGFIDIQNIYKQYQDQYDISQVIIILKPFSDLSKFKIKNLQRIQYRRQQVVLKRPRPEQIKHQYQKQKIQSKPIKKHIPQPVNQLTRKTIRQTLAKLMNKNEQMKKNGDCTSQANNIQINIFKQHQNNQQKYLELSNKIQKFFINLLNCHRLSAKIAKNQQKFSLINKILQSININNSQSLQQLQYQIRKRQKQQIIAQKPKQPQVQQQKIVQSLAPQPIDIMPDEEALRQQLKKQMKLFKQHRQGKQKHKKKKHKHHKQKKSQSPQAKFSSDQQQLPNYIQAEYNKQQIKQINQKQTDSPLRYDPDNQQKSSKQQYYAKGTILKLKNCEMQVVLKKQEKKQLNLQMLTDEDHRKLVDFVDPNFLKLTTKRKKQQSQIIIYLNNSKKKYKYLVGWFQSKDQTQNKILKQLAIQSSKQKKVYGCQTKNSIKMHIMSVRQLVQIPKLPVPSKVTSKSASQIFVSDRMVFIIQYPQPLYELREEFSPFILQKKQQSFIVSVPLPMSTPINIEALTNYKIPSIKPLQSVQGWGQPQNIPIISSIPIPPLNSISPLPQQINNIVPSKINQYRQHYGFGAYSPIISDYQQNQEEQQMPQDLAGSLLNSLEANKQSQKPYQNYYHYQYQQPRPMNDTWGGYPSYPPPPNRYAASNAPMPTPGLPLIYGNRPPPPPPPPSQYYQQYQGYQRQQ